MNREPREWGSIVVPVVIVGLVIFYLYLAVQLARIWLTINAGGSW